MFLKIKMQKGEKKRCKGCIWQIMWTIYNFEFDLYIFNLFLVCFLFHTYEFTIFFVFLQRKRIRLLKKGII